MNERLMRSRTSCHSWLVAGREHKESPVPYILYLLVLPINAVIHTKPGIHSRELFSPTVPAVRAAVARSKKIQNSAACFFVLRSGRKSLFEYICCLTWYSFYIVLLLFQKQDRNKVLIPHSLAKKGCQKRSMRCIGNIRAAPTQKNAIHLLPVSVCTLLYGTSKIYPNAKSSVKTRHTSIQSTFSGIKERNVSQTLPI